MALPRNIQQTNTAATSGAVAACSGATLVAAPSAKQATNGGTPALVPTSITILTTTKRAAIMFESAPYEPGYSDWLSGNWVVRLNVTSGTADAVWDDTYICRIRSDGTVRSTMGSLLNQSTAIAGGVASHVVATVASGGAYTDRVYIVLVFEAPGVPNGVFEYTPDQVITTRWVVLTPGPYTVDAVGSFVPGATMKDSFLPGAVAREAFVPGGANQEAFVPGGVAREVFVPGSLVGDSDV